MDAVRDPLADRWLVCSHYARHRPEDTLLYRIIDDNYRDFIGQLQAQGRSLPQFVRREFEEYLKCGRLDALSFLSPFPRGDLDNEYRKFGMQPPDA